MEFRVVKTMVTNLQSQRGCPNDWIVKWKLSAFYAAIILMGLIIVFLFDIPFDSMVNGGQLHFIIVV